MHFLWPVTQEVTWGCPSWCHSPEAQASPRHLLWPHGATPQLPQHLQSSSEGQQAPQAQLPKEPLAFPRQRPPAQAAVQSGTEVGRPGGLLRNGLMFNLEKDVQL